MIQRSHVLSSCLVLVLCISSVHVQTLGICDYIYDQYVETANKTLIQSKNQSLSTALDTCGGNAECGFVVVDTSGMMNLFKTISYEEYNVTGTPVYMYMKEASTCKTFSSYPYIYSTSVHQADASKCPSSRRLNSCSYQNTTSDVEADCPTTNQFCCFDTSQSSGSKCTDSYLYTCDVPYITGEVQKAVTTSPSSSGSGTDNHIIYVGEAVTITCTEDHMFSGDWKVDSNTQTAITCVLDSTNKKTTNIKSTLDQGQCAETCKGAYYDNTTTSITQVFPARKFTEIAITCRNGYGLEGGLTSGTKMCSVTEFSSLDNCTRCVPTASAGASYDKNSTTPIHSITQTCSSGYSIESTGAKTDKRMCKTDGFESDFSPCIKMCTLELIYSGNNAHSVPGNVTELAYKASIELTCPNGTLHITQSSTLTCDQPGANIKPWHCDVECSTIGSVSNGVPKVNGSTASSTVAAGTTLTAECKSNYAVWYGKTTEFDCSDDNYDVVTDKFKTVPECLRMCILEITTDKAKTLGQALVISGNARNVSDGDRVVKGEVISIHCKSQHDTVIKDHASDQNLTCDTSAYVLYPQSCMPPCNVTKLTGGNNNTVISPTPDVGTGSKVTFTCNSNYQLGEGDKLVESSAVTCNASAMLAPSVIPVTSSCYGKPTITATGSGEKKIQTVLTLPVDYDRSKSSVAKVIFKKDSTEIVSLTDVGGLTGASASLDTLLNIGSFSSSVTVTAEVYYTGVTKPKTASTTSPTGPASVTTASNSVTIVFTGRTSLKVTIAGFTVASIRNIYTSAKVRADIYEKTKKRAASPVYSMSITLDQLSGAALSIPSGKLNEGSSYSMTLTTVVTGGEGGSVQKDFTTGYDAPTVTSNVLSSTTNDLTITLSSGTPQDASYTVTYTVGGTATDATILFTNGVGTLSLIGLSAEGKYVYTIAITSGGVSSTSRSVTITQGPTEPTNLQNSLADMTDKAIVVTWSAVATNTYKLVLKSVSGNTETSVATGSTTAGNFTFSNLTAGGEYKVYINAEMTISGSQYSSAQVSTSITTYDCDVLAKKVNFELYTASGVLVADLYLRKDATTTFNISCATGYEPDSAGGTVDNTTSCIGANVWEAFTDCKVDTAKPVINDSDSDVVVGVVLGILAVVIIISIILILIYRRNKRKSSSARYNPSAEEKKSNEKDDPEKVEVVEVEPVVIIEPKVDSEPTYNTELELKEKDKEKDQGVEIDMDNIYMNEKTPEPDNDVSPDNDKRGTPDIPEAEPVEYDNNIADRGDNASQEVKIEFQDNEDEGEVHENKNADANV